MKLFKSNEIRQYQFIQIPKELLYSERYKTLSSDAKLLYGLLLDRMELSRENNWVNEKGEIYLIFTRDRIQSILQISDKTCTKAFKQLNEVELIKETKQGLGRPNLIFIGHIIYDNLQNSKGIVNRTFYDSEKGKATIQGSNKLRANNTNVNNTNSNLEEEETSLMEEVDETIFKTYKECISKKVSDMEIKTLRELQSLVGKEILNKAIITASVRNGKNLGYIQAVLDDWRKKGLKSIEQVDFHLADWLIMNKKAKENMIEQKRRKAENKNYGIKESTFNKFPQRTYDYDELENKLLEASYGYGNNDSN